MRFDIYLFVLHRFLKSSICSRSTHELPRSYPHASQTLQMKEINKYEDLEMKSDEQINSEMDLRHQDI